MRLHINLGERSRSVAITIDDPSATVGDLAAAIGVESDQGLNIDGTPVAADQELTAVGLVDGSIVSDLVNSNSTHPSNVASTDAFQLGVVAGVDSGKVVRLPAKSSVAVGRAVDPGLTIDNDTISGEHATIARGSDHALTVEDAGSRNGTWLGDEAVAGVESVELGRRIRVGSSTISVDPWRIDDRPVGVSPLHGDVRGRILFNRPPRALLPTGAAPILVPSAIGERTNPVFSIVALIVPIIFGVVMVMVLGSWRFALFALMSPLMLIGNYITGRRRVSKERAGDTESHADAMVRFEREVGAAVRRERELRAAVAPDLIEVRRRVEVPSSRLWERRPTAVDAMTIGLGRGDLSYVPSLERPSGTDPSDDAEATLAAHSTIRDVELLADLRLGPLGIVGDPEVRQGAARAALLQIATHHGPADVSVVVLTSVGRSAEWSWVQWLPHARAGNGGVLVLEGEAAEGFASHLIDQSSDASRIGGQALADAAFEPGWLIVVDDLTLLHGRSSPTRALLAQAERRVFGLVLVDTADQLPASTATVVTIEDADGTFKRSMPGRNEQVDAGIVDSVAAATAAGIARGMARFEDPELRLLGGALPSSLRPDVVLGASLTSSTAIRESWTVTKAKTALVAPIGVTESGLLSLDLVHDGPHALVAGTTGAGKSEFLRTLVLGLAASHGPDDLVFVLIDYKGGSAFDCCARLPHVVGMVTDLDDHLAERALQSLEAELHHRERVLRSAEATDIIEYRRASSPGGSLPRLVVIIDEFATLRAELPDFVASLIGIAQRGRSLGVHLVLATQRPSGALDANIRANTNLRVALRVQDAADSADVIDTKDAALISRETPGRAYVRRGNSDLVLAQTAYVSGPRRVGSSAPIRTAAIPIGSGAPPSFPDRSGESSAATDLEVAVESIVAAAAGMAAPRRPWLDDLPAFIDVDEVDALPSADEAPVVLAVGDDPRKQRRVTHGWNPSDGALVAYGGLGSGVTTLLRSCAARLRTGIDGRPVWVFAADHSASGLTGIEAHEHVACRLEPTDEAGHLRLMAMLVDVMDERRMKSAAAAAALPLVVLLVDGIAGFLEVIDGGNSGDTDEFARIVRDGPAVGIVIVAGVTRAGEVPRSLAGTVRTRFVMELADSGEYAMLGIKGRKLPAFRAGRVLLGSEPTVAQVVNWESAIERLPWVGGPPPPPVEELPKSVDRHDLGGTVRIEPDLSVPFALDDRTRSFALLAVRQGEHVTIAGPSGSGRTTTLRTIAAQLRDADPTLVLVGIAPTEQGALFTLDVFDALGTADSLNQVLSTAEDDDRRWVLLVDDADRIDVEEGALVELARNAPAGVTIIAAVRSTTTRQAYGHWTRHVRASGVGLLLQPDNAVDGELLAVRLPRGERLDQLPGRGYLIIGGAAAVVQVAHC